MEMKKIILALATVGLLTSCGGHTPSTETQTETQQPTITESETTSEDKPTSSETETVPHSSETTEDSSSSETTDTGSTETTPDEPIKESYKVNIKTTSDAITLVSDKAKASEGELVTITATINDANYQLLSVSYDSTACTKVNDTTYTFTMPNHPVFITCTYAILNGDVKLEGGITAAFAKEGDIYVARNVKVATDSEFNFIVKDSNGTEKSLGITSFDRTKTFANIGFTYGNSEYDLKIDGGSTYDFFYDPANGERPCYVKRVKVNQLPTSPAGLYKLFGGSIATETSVLPDNLASTKFVNSLTAETLEWHRYNDNSSLAEVSKLNMSGEKVVKSVVYNKIEGDKLTVVDTFVPGTHDAYKDNNILSRDKKVFSGEYKISDVEDDGDKTSLTEFKEFSNYVHPLVAQMNVNTSPITMEAYENEVMSAYRVGFTVEGEVTQANAKVDSVANQDGTFNVSLISSKTIDSTNDRTSTGTKVKKHYEYRVDFVFSEAGALLKSNYASKSYADGEYDFDALQFVNGTIDTNWENNGTIVKQLSIENTFGEPASEPKAFDTSKYLVSEIKNVKVVNKEIKDKEGNRLNLGDRLEITNDPETSIVTFDVLPETALNKNQYKIIASSNENVIKKTFNYWEANTLGESEITIGIPNGFGATAKAKVNVYCTYMLRSVYLYDEYGKYPHQTGTNTAIVYTNNIMPYRIQCHKSDGNKVVPMPRDMKAEFQGESYGMTVSFDYDKQIMLVDARNTTAQNDDKVKLKITSAIYDPDWMRSDIIFTLTVKKAINPDALVGEWKITGEDQDRVFFTKEAMDPNSQGYNEKRPYKGKLVCLGVTYEFSWGFEPLANRINVSLLDNELQHSLLDMIYDDSTETLSVIFVIKKWTNPPTPDEEILGYEGDDGDNVYIDFKKVGANDAQ